MSFMTALATNDRIFGLDTQLLIDIGVVLIAVFVLFMFMSYMFFNPAREFMEKRQAKIQNDLDVAKTEKAEACDMKEKYDAKIKNVDKESEEILKQARKKAVAQENEMLEKAKVEANRILERANKEVELEKIKVKDQLKQEMVQVASVMAEKFVAVSMDQTKQDQLINDTLQEMGEDTWQN